jgi:Ca-activated chloride channel family protein
MAALAIALLLVRLGAQTPPISVRITSPLGRTGVAGTVRIVAQVRTADERAAPVVRFLVDGKQIKLEDHGGPYSADWMDDDPLEERIIVVEASDAAGHKASDQITLKPYRFDDQTHVSAVVLEAAVYNKTGRYVSGLSADDFTLRENDVEQKIDLVSQQATPVVYGLLIDSSQSMAHNVDFVRQAARRLSNYLRPIDRVLVAPFSTGLGPVTGPTADRQTVVEAIGATKDTGGTAILDSLAQMADRIRNLPGRRAIILLTDGYDENSTKTMDDTLKVLHEVEASVYAVGIGGIAGVSFKGQEEMRRLARETGGRAFFPFRSEDLPETYDTLAVDVQTRYLLAYTPTNTEPDGSWRAIDVTTKAGDLVTQTRAGYYAPKPPPVRATIEFTLTDADEKYFDVSVEDLVVVEDGVEQKIDVFHEAISPVSVVLALDASGSMRRSTADAVRAARDFVQALRPEDALAVELFADRTTLMQDISKEREHSLEAIDKYFADGGTALYDALCDAFLRLSRVEGRRAVVVVTDGRDENNPGTGPGSVRGFNDVTRLLRQSGSIVYGIGIGSRVDRTPLEELAKASGGQAYFPADASQLADPYRRIVENLRRRFVVSYPSTNEARDGSWRNVEIHVRSGNLTVSSAGGYFAPEK